MFVSTHRDGAAFSARIAFAWRGGAMRRQRGRESRAVDRSGSTVTSFKPFFFFFSDPSSADQLFGSDR